MHIHELYRSSFNVVDMHNAKRQGGASLEDTWKTHKWWVRDFQVFVGMSEVNAYLLFNKFCRGVPMEQFRRTLVWEMLNHPLVLLEREQRRITRALAAASRVPTDKHCPMQTMERSGSARLKGTCAYCPKRVTTFYSCGEDPGDAVSAKACNKTIFLCSAASTGRACFAAHLRGDPVVNGKSEAAKERWSKLRRTSATPQQP